MQLLLKGSKKTEFTQIMTTICKELQICATYDLISDPHIYLNKLLYKCLSRKHKCFAQLPKYQSSHFFKRILKKLMAAI